MERPRLWKQKRCTQNQTASKILPSLLTQSSMSPSSMYSYISDFLAFSHISVSLKNKMSQIMHLKSRLWPSDFKTQNTCCFSASVRSRVRTDQSFQKWWGWICFLVVQRIKLFWLIGFGSRATGPTQVRGHVILTLHVLHPFMKHKHVRYTNTMLSEKQEWF